MDPFTLGKLTALTVFLEPVFGNKTSIADNGDTGEAEVLFAVAN